MFTEAFLFDLDGTLTDSDPLHFEAFAETARGYGVLIDEEVFRAHVSGQTNANICRNLFAHIDAAHYEKIADDKEALFRRLIIDRLTPVDGLFDLLDWAKARGVAMALVSNAPRLNIIDMLAQLGVADRFDEIVVGSELPRGKPDPLPYLTALKRLGVSADRAVAFEDAPPGLKAAHAAGVATVGVTTGLTADDVKLHGADIAVADYRDPALLPFITRALAGNRA